MIKIVLLGLTQGVTEFLPVSSSGHLALLHYLWSDHPLLILDILAHLGSLIAIIWFFRSDLALLKRGLLGKGDQKMIEKQRLLATRLFLASLPIVVAGFFWGEKLILLFSSPKLLAIGFWITALLLVLGRFWRLPIGRGRFLGVGFFQVLSIIPGVSRSASTVAGARILGEEKETAFKFSFFLGLIAIVAAVVYEVPKISRFNSWQFKEGAVVILVSFLSGLLALTLLRRLFLSNRMWYLAFYCFFLGMAIFFLL